MLQVTATLLAQADNQPDHLAWRTFLSILPTDVTGNTSTSRYALCRLQVVRSARH